MINLCEILHEMFAHTIESNLVNERVVCNKTDNPIAVSKTICCPAKESDVGVVELIGQSCIRCLRIGLMYTHINYWIRTVLIVLILILLSHVVRWIPNYNHNLRVFLALHSFCILLNK